MIKKTLLFLSLMLLISWLVFLELAIIHSQKENIAIMEALKIDSKKIMREIKDVIYYQATVHNPEGDMLPDEIDDTIKEQIKNQINE